MQREKKEEQISRKELAIKITSFHYLRLINIGVQIAVIWLSRVGSIFPGAETIASIAGTCSEIIAGLYGITLASYTFFLSRIDALMASDATLSHIVQSIKKSFKRMIWAITFCVFVTLTVSVILMYVPMPSGGETGFFYRLFCNEFLLSIASSFGLIMWYALWVIDPNCIEKEAKKLKKKISPISKPAGSVTEFIMLYNQIEEKCNAMIPQSALRQIQENKGNQFEFTIELMKELPMDMKLVLPGIEQMHMYYECVVNCKELSVSEAMCQKAKWILQVLDKKTK